MSGELATKLTGRYVETEMFALGFSEYLGMKAFLGMEPMTDAQEFEQWLAFGGFPRALRIDEGVAKGAYVRDVIGQIFEKDIRSRKRIRNRAAFERSTSYVINNFGATTSLTNIVGYLDSVEGVKIKKQTLGGYLDLLENALFIHLLSKGYSVSAGRIGRLECDFIARKGDEYAYVQVSMTVADPDVERCEYAPFAKIRDGWPRYLFTLDPLRSQRDGVKHLNLMEFLKADGDLL